MTPDQSGDFVNAEERLSQMMETVKASAILTLEAIKLRIGYHEKLVILNAGTLALTFSAATAYRTQQSHPLSSDSSVIHAWQLLIAAIVLSLISNWLSVNTAFYHGNWNHINQLGVSFARYERTLQKVLPDYAKEARAEMDIEADRFRHSRTYLRVFNRIAAITGVIAQFATCWAFICLYRFAKASLTRT